MLRHMYKLSCKQIVQHNIILITFFIHLHPFPLANDKTGRPCRLYLPIYLYWLIFVCNCSLLFLQQVEFDSTETCKSVIMYSRDKLLHVITQLFVNIVMM
jgi:hypothetical protein